MCKLFMSDPSIKEYLAEIKSMITQDGNNNIDSELSMIKKDDLVEIKDMISREMNFSPMIP